MNNEIEELISLLDKNVIVSETDSECIITNLSTAFCNISGYTKEELIGNPHNIVRDPGMTIEIF